MARKIINATPEQLSVRGTLSKFADVLMPGDAEAPILGPSVRGVLIDWMREINARAELEAIGVKPRRTALLYGPPGCGKTTFAHHLAARLGLPLACVRSESVIESWLGSTGRNIGQLFDAMSETEGQVVIFFDEVDALGGKRMQDQGASVERANSLNVLLRRIEQFDGICLAATNRQDSLDTALWRRFDMQISIDLPGDDERFAILRRYFHPFALADDDIDLLVGLTDGASPALIRGLVEGVKRTIVVSGKSGRDLQNATDAFATVIRSVSPPPEYENIPPLWGRTDEALNLIGALSWPLSREEKPEAA